MNRPDTGFSLIELAVVLTIMGIVLAIGIPTYRLWGRTQALHAASRALGGELQQMRARAMATGRTQTIHFALDSTGAGDYHVHEGGRIAAAFDLPRGVVYTPSTPAGFSLLSDGRSTESRYVVLTDERGTRDTVSVQLSGLVLVR